MHAVLGLYIFLFSSYVWTHPADTLSKKDSTNAFELHLGFEWYCSYNSYSAPGTKLPLFVSFGHSNEWNNNLIYLDLKYQRRRWRGQFLPAMGTFMEQNSASEKGIFKHLLESNLGFRPFQKRNLWIDAGVFGSPYTNESPFSKDQLILTRSLSAEYVPYYLAGIRLSGAYKNWLTWHVYLLNGWQQINDINTSKSFGSKVELTMNSKNKFNCNTYLGKEGVSGSKNYGMRYFLDVFWTHDFSPNVSFISCGYMGLQNLANNQRAKWVQINGALRYNTKKYGAFNVRAEYFYDPQNVVVAPLIENEEFRCFGFSLGYTYPILKTFLFRTEYRRLNAQNGKLYTLSDGTIQPTLNLFTTALTFWF
jgi:hypothetical protein